MHFYKDHNVVLPAVVVIQWGQAGLGSSKIPKADI